jgi:molybdopterin converting factor small subunit
MKKVFSTWCSLLAVSALALLVLNGCSKKDAQDAVDAAGDAAQEAADDISEGAKEVVDTGKEAVEKGKEIASELGEQAVAYLTPLKEKLGGLESLKDKPEELKTAVNDLIKSMEDKAEDLKLPEAISNTLATVKEKLVALKDYLEGEVEQAQIDERIAEIMDSVKSGLGLSD